MPNSIIFFMYNTQYVNISKNILIISKVFCLTFYELKNLFRSIISSS